MTAAAIDRSAEVRDSEEPPAVAVRGLRKRYGDTVAVDGLSFVVRTGEIFGLIGPNGSGKTTTVECLQGLRDPDEGELSVLGLDPRRSGAALRRRIGCQLQDSALPERIKVWEALDLFASLSSATPDWKGLVDAWGLGAKRDSSFHSLSGGQRQRLFVALALVNRPDVVFLDEMTTGLDPEGRRVAWDLIGTIREQGATVVLVTHFMEEAERLCDRVAVLRSGRIVAEGTPAWLAAEHGGSTRISFTASDGDTEWIERLPAVERIERRGARLEISGGPTALPLVSAGLLERGRVPDDMRIHQPTLEDAFLNLVGSDE